MVVDFPAMMMFTTKPVDIPQEFMSISGNKGNNTLIRKADSTVLREARVRINLEKEWRSMLIRFFQNIASKDRRYGMIEIEKQAVQQLREFRDRRGPESAVRIGIMSGSLHGPMLGVSADDKSDSDEVFSFDDLEVIVDSALLRYCEKITVEYVVQEGGGCSGGGGFRITPKNTI